MAAEAKVALPRRLRSNGLAMFRVAPAASVALFFWGPALRRGAEILRVALRWTSQHTGLPVMLVAAIVMVVSVRVLRRSARWAIEVVAVLLVLAYMTRLGWIAW
jgi:hypothetical protein